MVEYYGQTSSSSKLICLIGSINKHPSSEIDYILSQEKYFYRILRISFLVMGLILMTHPVHLKSKHTDSDLSQRKTNENYRVSIEWSYAKLSMCNLLY